MSPPLAMRLLRPQSQELKIPQQSHAEEGTEQPGEELVSQKEISHSSENLS